MSNLLEQISQLSPEKRALLEKMLAQKNGKGPSLKKLPIKQFQRRSGTPEIGEPLSYAQSRLWFLDRLDPNNPAYNIPIAVRLEGEIDAARFEQTLQVLVDRHETLRTTFDEVDGVPVQVIAPAAPLSLNKSISPI